MMERQDERTPELNLKTALDIAAHLHIALRMIKVYAPNNVGFVERLKEFYVSLGEAFRFESEIQVQIRRDTIFVNKTRLKFNVANYAVYRSLFEEFVARQVGTMAFSIGLTEEELSRFLVFLSPRERSHDVSFERLAEEFEAAAFPHIRLEKLPEEARAETAEKSAIPIYILGVYHLKDIFESDKRSMNIHLTRRWIQSLINHLMSHESVLIGLTNIKNFEEYTLNHSVNVCILSLALGRRLGLSRPELIQLGISACLHDVGKFDIPNEVLEKPGKLDDAERAVIEKHAHFGAAKLTHRRKTEDIPEAAIQVAMEHHIKPTWGGYPNYIRRKRVNFFSKIVKVVDYYDAITTKRVYRPKTFTPAEALRLMKKNCAEEFDPYLFKIFAQMIGIYPVGTLAALNTGEVGVVIENNSLPAFASRPLVKLIADAEGRKIDGPVADLAETDPVTGRFRRTIVKTLDPETYNVPVADYLIAQAQ